MILTDSHSRRGTRNTKTPPYPVEEAMKDMEFIATKLVLPKLNLEMMRGDNKTQRL